MRGIINRNFKRIKKNRYGFFEGDVVVLLIETILSFVPFDVGCGVGRLHSSAFLPVLVDVRQFRSEDSHVRTKQEFWHS
jgi:hypothetical protein